MRSLLSHGPVMPILLYIFALFGCLLTLLCLRRAPATSGWAQAGWLALGAWSIGTTVVWDMSLLLAVQIRAEGDQLRFALDWTISGILGAIVVAGLGLWLVGARPPSTWR